MTLGARVRQLRGKRGLKQIELAAKVGIRPHTLWRIEAGQVANPRTRVLQGLARELGVTVDFLLTGSSQPRRASA